MKTLEAYALIILTTASLAFATGCGRDDKDDQDKASAPAGDDALPDDEGGGDGGGKKDGKKDDKPKDSVSLYKDTAYPLLTEWCAACHSAGVRVLFTHPDVVKAHDEIVSKQKVNFEDVRKSHVVRQLEANHNCPVSGCDAAIDELVPALQEWADALKQQNDDKDTLPTTDTLRLADAATSTVPGGNPPGVLMLEAESGVLKAPFRMVDSGTASGGKIVDTPAGAGTQNNAQNAAANNNLGTMIYTFEVVEAGTYRVHGLVNGPTAANNAFWLRMDNGGLLGWIFQANGDAFGWDTADAVEAVGTPHQFNLTAGTHTLEIRQRREQAKFDKLVLSNDPMFNPAQAQPAERDVNLLTYDISEQTGIAGAKFTVEVTDYSVNAYMFKNPSIVLPSGKVEVKNVKLLINDVFLPEHATFTIVDKTVVAPGGSLTSAALIALKDRGTDADEFSFTFDVLKEGK